MASKPRTPKSTVKIRRLPKVGDPVKVDAVVTRIAGEGDDMTLTVRIKATGHLTTARAEYLLPDEDGGQ